MGRDQRGDNHACGHWGGTETVSNGSDRGRRSGHGSHHELTATDQVLRMNKRCVNSNLIISCNCCLALLAQIGYLTAPLETTRVDGKPARIH